MNSQQQQPSHSLVRSLSLPREQYPKQANHNSMHANANIKGEQQRIQPKNYNVDRDSKINSNSSHPANESFVFSGSNRFATPNSSNNVSPSNQYYKNSMNDNSGVYAGDRRNDNVFSIPANIHEDKTYFNNRDSSRGMNYRRN